LVIRLWLEPHDNRVRARLLVSDVTPEPLIGIDQILSAVAAAVSAFERRHEWTQARRET
jgi:hypothetical protein